MVNNETSTDSYRSSDSSVGRPSSFKSAIGMLDTALKNTDAAHLEDLVSGEISHIKALVAEMPLGESTVGEALQEVRKNLARAGSLLAGYSEGAYDLSRRIDEEVRANPWPVVCGAALGTFAIGFILSRRQ